MSRLCVAGLFSLMFALAGVQNASALELGGADGVIDVSEEQLSNLPQITLRTSTPFTDGVIAFEGPLARDVLALVGGDLPDIATFVAANDFAVEIPLSEFRKYDVIFATHMNGKRMSLRDKGPIWVMYPLDRHEELSDPVFNSRLIWQLVRIELE